MKKIRDYKEEIRKYEHLNRKINCSGLYDDNGKKIVAFTFFKF